MGIEREANFGVYFTNIFERKEVWDNYLIVLGILGKREEGSNIFEGKEGLKGKKRERERYNSW